MRTFHLPVRLWSDNNRCPKSVSLQQSLLHIYGLCGRSFVIKIALSSPVFSFFFLLILFFLYHSSPLPLSLSSSSSSSSSSTSLCLSLSCPLSFLLYLSLLLVTVGYGFVSGHVLSTAHRPRHTHTHTHTHSRNLMQEWDFRTFPLTPLVLSLHHDFSLPLFEPWLMYSRWPSNLNKVDNSVTLNTSFFALQVRLHITPNCRKTDALIVKSEIRSLLLIILSLSSDLHMGLKIQLGSLFLNRTATAFNSALMK